MTPDPDQTPPRKSPTGYRKWLAVALGLLAVSALVYTGTA